MEIQITKRELNTLAIALSQLLGENGGGIRPNLEEKEEISHLLDKLGTFYLKVKK